MTKSIKGERLTMLGDCFACLSIKGKKQKQKIRDSTERFFFLLTGQDNGFLNKKCCSCLDTFEISFD